MTSEGGLALPLLALIIDDDEEEDASDSLSRLIMLAHVAVATIISAL